MTDEKTFNGVTLTNPRKHEVIKAPDLDVAKAKMTRLHGPERDEKGATRWVCGVAPESF